ncbi:hydrolase [Nitrospira sp.]|nr:hydrolase [Nitrospira sp.]
MMKQPRVDSHQHFWRLERGDYHWLTKDLATICRDFEPADLRPHLEHAGVKKTILVQAAESEAETDYLLSLAENTDFIAGVVGWVDMENPRTPPRLQSLSRNMYLRGVRPMIPNLANPEWMLSKTLEPAFHTLIELDLSFDALVFPHHLKHLLTLLQRHPRLRTVIDHGAKPNIASGHTAEWTDDIAAIASETQSYCKVSGLVTEAGDFADVDGLSPYVQHLHQQFGAERLMWGSDWPVVNLSMDYSAWDRLSQQLLKPLPDAERQHILADTATRFYRL